MNYPDDIRQWDWHPDSPFYSDPLSAFDDLTEKELREALLEWGSYTPQHRYIRTLLWSRQNA